MTRKPIYQKYPLRPYILMVLLLFASTLTRAQTPLKADELVNSIGINTHFNYSDRPYVDRYPEVRDLLGETGIRFIRDQVDEVDSRRQTDWWDKYGIRAVLFPQAFKKVGRGRYPDPSQLPELLGIIRDDYGLNRVIATMGLNEWDKALDSTGVKKRRSMWAPEWRLQQQALYDAVKADPALSSLPVIMGPLANSGNIEFLGDVSGMVDIGNDHPYPSADGLPGQDRSGPEPRDVNTVINRIRAVAGADVPIWFSETGYSESFNEAGDAKYPSGRARAKYMPRLLVDHFRNQEIKKTFIYELLSSTSSNPWGLVNLDFTKTDAFYTVKNLISLCGEAQWDANAKEWITPPEYTPQALNYTLEGDLDSLDQLLLQKSDGSYLLLLWQEVRSYQYTGDSISNDINHPLRDIQVRLNERTASSVNVYRLYNEDNPSVALAPLQTYQSTSQISVGVPDDIIALEIILDDLSQGGDSTFSVGDCTFTSDNFLEAQEITAVSSITYADFSRNNSSYVVGITTGIREDGLAGAWEVHNDCSVQPIRRTGQGDNTTRLPEVRGLERNRGWNYLPDSISADGQYIYATAVNENGFTHARGWTIAPGTTLAVRFQLGSPFYGRIFGISSEILCDDLQVETFAGNFFVTGCEDDTTGAVFASQVVAYAPGLRQNGRSVVAERSDPLLALGAPQENDAINFVSLGFGGSLTLMLDRPIADRPGTDLRVVETSFNDVNRPCEAYPERADVAVSADGVDFVQVVEGGCKDIEVDLAGSGLNEVQYVRITDVSDPSRFGGNADGYDVDGVMQIIADPINGRRAGFLAKANYAPDEVADVPDVATTELAVYPNPASGQLTVKAAGSEAYQVKVYDLTGRVMLERDHLKGTVHLDVSGLRPGLYLVKLHDNKQHELQQRILVK